MSEPQVLLRFVEEAAEALRQAGMGQITITQTTPPRGYRPGGQWRVVRQRRAHDGGVELVTARFAPPNSETPEGAKA